MNYTSLWPYAIREVNNALNNTPNMQDPHRRSPKELFSGSPVSPNLKHMHPFGAPTYVLAAPLQKNEPYGKWKERSRRGVYLGQSPNHASSVALVLDLYTGLVSPQFHVKVDHGFETVQDDNSKYTWLTKAGFTNPEPKPTSPSAKKIQKQPKPSVPRTQTKRSISAKKQKQQKRNISQTIPSKSQEPKRSKQPSTDASPKPTAPQPSSSPPALPERRSKRQRTAPNRLITSCVAEMTTSSNGVPNEIFAFENLFPNPSSLAFQDELHAYKSTADPDTLYYHEAMREPDKKQFQVAMDKELNDNIEKGNIELIHKSQVPEGASILRAVWQLRRKRHILTQEVKKWKARINVDGSQMIYGLHYDKTYAPVAKWSLIRLVLIISLLQEWPTRQLDYTLAFPQAPIERDLYMKVPAGYNVENGNKNDYVFRLNKNLYGQKQAGRVWYLHLKKTLKQIGFKRSKHDECLFYRGNVIYILYTDDSIITAPTQKEIDQVIKDIRNAGLVVTDEGDINDFLGVNITQRSATEFELTQPHLIMNILKDLCLDDDKVKTKENPATSSRILHRHQSSPDFDKSFNYKSVIGKLGYLEKGSRPDIAYITHQCARFSSSPKKEHGEALRWLGRYLNETKDKGTIMTVDKTKGLEVYVDADYAGNWDPKDTKNPDTVRSRHGYAIYYAGCPILCKSQLQTEITLSSTESEYTGLSYALREAIPIINILEEISSNLPIHHPLPKIHCKVFEDNAGALEIASTHKYRPRTKHLNNRLHHFRSYVTSKKIEILKIDTKSQIADIFTKPLDPETFKNLRKKLLGW